MRLCLPALLALSLAGCELAQAATLGEQLADCRRVHDWSQKVAGHQVNVSASTWGRWEGDLDVPGALPQERLAQLGSLSGLQSETTPAGWEWRETDTGGCWAATRPWLCPMSPP